MVNKLTFLNFVFVVFSSLSNGYAWQSEESTQKNIEISSFNKSFNSVTNKYEYVIEGKNKEQDFLYLKDLSLLCGEQRIPQTRQETIFFSNSVIPNNGMFVGKYESAADFQDTDISFYGYKVLGVDYNSHYQGLSAEQPTSENEYVYSFNCNFDNLTTRSNGGQFVKHCAIVHLTYDIKEYFVFCSDCTVGKHNSLTVSIWSEKVIDKTLIQINSVIDVNDKEKLDNIYNDKNQTIKTLLKVLLWFFAITIGIFAASIIGVFIYRAARKKHTN